MARAALILILGMSLIPFGDSAGRILVDQHGVAPVFVGWARFWMGALLLLPFLGVADRQLELYRDWRIWLRGALIISGVFCILTALRTEHLPNVFGAFFIGPMVSYVLSALLLGERVTVARSTLVGLGFCGVLLVVRPGFGMTPGLGFAVLAGCFYGSYLTASRWLGGVAPPRALMMSQLATGAILAAPLGAFHVPQIDLEIAGLLIWSAAASMGGNLLLVFAYRRAQATRLAPFVYFQLIAAVFFGWAIFGDIPDLLTFTGLGLLIASGFASLALRR